MNEDRSHPAPDQASPQGAVPIRVLAAVILREGCYLVGLRPSHKRHGGYWEFPGGKVESGESLLDAARRELREELGVEAISAGYPIFTRQDSDSPFIIEFTEVEIAGVPQALEHDEIRWASASALQKLQLAPSDRSFSETLPARVKSNSSSPEPSVRSFPNR
jgi:mutator protein MutT